MAEHVKCPVCNSLSDLYQLGPLNTLYFYECPVCGRYEVSELGPFDGININHLSSYLVTIQSRRKCNKIVTNTKRIPKTVCRILLS